MGKTLYINKPGGALVKEESGVVENYPYGKEVDLDVVHPDAAKHIHRVTSTKKPPDAPADPLQQNLEAALIEAGQYYTTASAVPGNYEELTEDQAVRLVQSVKDEGSQAQIIAHELENEGRQRVLDAASSDDVMEMAEVFATVQEHKASKDEKKSAPAKTEKSESAKEPAKESGDGNTPPPTSKS